MLDEMKRTVITAPAVAVHGNDIDTDRIVPARFLKCVTFDGLGEHAFEDDRLQLTAAGKVHPFDVPSHADAQILVVNKNFGCGSSREHAPQAIMRWGKGIQAIVGESFAEIFFANCVALGIPCLTVSEADSQAIQVIVDANPSSPITVDLLKSEIRAGDKVFKGSIPEGNRQQFVEGTWDATVELLAALPAIQSTASGLPYVSNWKA
jgi:3-isopropylmalate/(R)-2-methylmalate dehydratase small subunit